MLMFLWPKAHLLQHFGDSWQENWSNCYGAGRLKKGLTALVRSSGWQRTKWIEVNHLLICRADCAYKAGGWPEGCISGCCVTDTKHYFGVWRGVTTVCPDSARYVPICLCCKLTLVSHVARRREDRIVLLSDKWIKWIVKLHSYVWY